MKNDTSMDITTRVDVRRGVALKTVSCIFCPSTILKGWRIVAVPGRGGYSHPNCLRRYLQDRFDEVVRGCTQCRRGPQVNPVFDPELDSESD